MIGQASICLNMIVKNEAHVIGRCLNSLKYHLDHWVIVDTGSTDGTQAIVRDSLDGIPGELIERPWVDFGHNRSEAIALARGKADYLLIIDADELFEVNADIPKLDKDFYYITIVLGGTSYRRVQLINNRLSWRYVGVLHEYLSCPEATSEATLEGVRIVSLADGARSLDPVKYRRDALTLERALLDEPDNERYMFYLAQSYRDAGDFELALRSYRRRVERGGWAEETWYAQFQIAEIMARTGVDWRLVMAAYLDAFERRPHRAEPLFRIARHFMDAQRFDTAAIFLATAGEIPYPTDDKLFVEDGLYRYVIPMEIAVCAFWRGQHGDAIRLNDALLAGGNLPPEQRQRVIKNRQFSIDALHSAIAAAIVQKKRD